MPTDNHNHVGSSLLRPDKDRAKKLQTLFKQSKSVRESKAANEAELESLTKSGFFATVGTSPYIVKCTCGFGRSAGLFVLFAVEQGEKDTLVSVTAEITPKGQLVALMEQMIQPLGKDGTYLVKGVNPLAPSEDPMDEIGAERILDQMLDDLLARSESLPQEKWPSHFKQAEGSPLEGKCAPIGENGLA